MRPKKSNQITESQNITNKTLQNDPGHVGLRILAGWISDAYLDELANQRLKEIGGKPRMFLDTIQLKMTGIDINDPDNRKKIHDLLDEAIEATSLRVLEGNKTPWVFKKEDVAIKLKFW
jgi:hypothetical protein